MPKIFYGMHFQEGLAEYENEKDRLLIRENTIKQMNPTFAGRPVYVNHQTVNEDKIQQEADGYVVESFFNKFDGKHWAKFIVVSQKGIEAIQKGWKLSNSYIVKNNAIGGRWHNIEYSSEVIDAEFDHLAIVERPRYEESIILTPEQFKAYNSKKEAELKILQNSIDELPYKGRKIKLQKTGSQYQAYCDGMGFTVYGKTPDEAIERAKQKVDANNKGNSMFGKIFKKTAVENEVEILNAVITLKNGKEISIADLIKKNEVEVEEPKNESKVKVGEEEMTVNELVEKYMELKNKMNEDDKAKKELEEKSNAEKLAKEEEEKKKNAEEAAAKAKAEEEAKKNLNAIQNAHNNVVTSTVVETSTNKVARGKKLYGSK